MTVTSLIEKIALKELKELGFELIEKMNSRWVFSKKTDQKNHNISFTTKAYTIKVLMLI